MSDSPSTTSWARDASWLLAANVLRNVGLIVILVLLARFTSQEVVGRYAIALAMTTPIFTFAQLGLKGVYLTMRRNHRFDSYLQVQVAMILLAIIVSLVFGLVFTPAAVLTVALVALIKAADAFSDLLAGVFQRYHRSAWIFMAYLGGALLGSAATAFALAITRELNVALGGLAVTSLLTAIVFLGLTARRLVALHEDSSHQELSPAQDRRSILRAGLPTGVAASILALVASMPQFFLAQSHGSAPVGHFAVLLYVVALADIFTGTLTQTWIPTARAALAGDRTAALLRTVTRTTGWWTAIFLPVTVTGLVLTWFALPILFGKDYTLDLGQAVPLAVCVLLFPAVHFSGTSIVVHNLYTHNLGLSLIVLAVCFVACLAFIPPASIAGALWATAAAEAGRAAAGYGLLGLVTRRRSAPHTSA